MDTMQAMGQDSFQCKEHPLELNMPCISLQYHGSNKAGWFPIFPFQLSEASLHERMKTKLLGMESPGRRMRSKPKGWETTGVSLGIESIPPVVATTLVPIGPEWLAPLGNNT